PAGRGRGDSRPSAGPVPHRFRGVPVPPRGYRAQPDTVRLCAAPEGLGPRSPGPDGRALRHPGRRGAAFPLARPLVRPHGRPGPVFNIYGPTETTVWVTCKEITAAIAAAETDSVLGRPLVEGTVGVADEHLDAVPPGGTGEILIGGEQVSLGYAGQ